MFNTSLVGNYFDIPSPVVALSSFRSWSRRTLSSRLDLCTQACYSQIIPGLYLSNERAAIDPNILKHLNITHVLTIKDHRLPKSSFEGTNIQTLFIRAYDNPHTNLLPYFPMANSFIDEGIQKGNVLVHCHFGVSRSATLVIAYLMERYKLTYEQAYTFVKQKRRFINPNTGFVSQLKEFEAKGYDVSNLKKFEAYLNVTARKHKYKLASFAAVIVGVIVPLAILVG